MLMSTGSEGSRRPDGRVTCLTDMSQPFFPGHHSACTIDHAVSIVSSKLPWHGWVTQHELLSIKKDTANTTAEHPICQEQRLTLKYLLA